MNSTPEARVLIHEAEVVVTMDAQRREIRADSVLVRGKVIEAVGDREYIEQHLAAEPHARVTCIDARRSIILPGLVNGHHHLYQTLTRSIGTAGGLLPVRLAEDALSDLGRGGPP
jgi:8-oxoguanine deaminase